MNSNMLEDFRVQHPQPSDEQLLSEAKCGDRRAFAELCQRYKRILRQRIFMIVRHREDTEDVLQETFLKAYQHLQDFRGACKFSTWLTRIGINGSVMHLRKRKAKLKTAPERDTDDALSRQMYDVPDSRPDPEERYMRDEARKRLVAAIHGLPPQLRSIVHLYYEKERHVKEVAETLGISESAAKSRILRARHRLRCSLNNHRSLTRSKQ